MKQISGLNYFNSTPHPVNMLAPDGTEHVIEPDAIISARPVEVSAGTGPGGIELVRTEFSGSPEGFGVIASARANGADVIIGSIIAAQAYPGLVYAMIPAPGFERVPPNEKKMRTDKFTIF